MTAKTQFIRKQSIYTVENMNKTILILGGTVEARHLAIALAARPKLRLIYSLAGVTAPQEQTNKEFHALGIAIRRGGFGGVDGLVHYLKQEQIDALLDATHPFAIKMAENGLLAARRHPCHWAKIWREPWRPAAKDHWNYVPDIKASIAKLWQANRYWAQFRRIFLALGSQGCAEWDRQWQIKLNQSPQPVQNLPDIILARHYRDAPPHNPTSLTLQKIQNFDGLSDDLPAERALLLDHKIDLMISRESGGKIPAKLIAAREIACPVWLIKRPDLGYLSLRETELSQIYATPEQFLAESWVKPSG